MSAFLERYATFANFGGGTVAVELPREPHILNITCPDTIKRRLPTKHYVYKIVVQWSNGSTTVVYRRYSMFFDFQIKLQELHTNLCQRNPVFAESAPVLPDLPGKILFGRTQIHQVAEKRRGKVEEFCQHLIALPSELSESTLVLGFFNTWPQDTMLPQEHHVISAPTPVERPSSPPLISPPPILASPPHSSSSTRRPSSPSSATSWVQSPATPLSPSKTAQSPPFSPTDAIISHPDEMENLEQYRVVADYVRKDSHQVDLTAGQIVHVIEKHDTGWWMVMTEDEQGYAPAAYLESVEGRSEVQHPENNTSEAYEAMETYKAENEDEVGFSVGDRIEVLSKSMDGWWRIRCKDKVGFSPATLIRRKISSTSPTSFSPNVPIYESEKSIYEGLNIHRPPPRRNTISIKKVVPPPNYDVPRPTNPKAIDDDIYVDPASESDDDDTSYYRVPRPGVLSSKESSPMTNGTSHSPPRERGTGNHCNAIPPPSLVPGPAPVLEESPYEVDPPDARMPIYQNTDEALLEESPYENHTLEASHPSVPQPSESKSSGPALPPRNTPTHSTPKPPVPTAPKPSLLPTRPGSDHTVDDYVDLDEHDEYVNPDLLTSGHVSAVDLPLPTVPRPPPLPASAPPKTRPKTNQARSSVLSDTILSPPVASSPAPSPTTTPATKGLHSLDDEYIEMDPLYAEVPPEEPEETPAPPLSPRHEPLGKRKSTPRVTPPRPPQPYSAHKFSKMKSAPDILPSNSNALTRTKSLEDILSTSPKEKPFEKRHSPPLTRKVPLQPPNLPSRRPHPLTPPHLKDRSVGMETTDGSSGSPKPPPAKIIAGAKFKRGSSNGDHTQGFKLPTPPSQHPIYEGIPDVALPPSHAPLTSSMSHPTGDVLLPKTYVAISSYTSQAAGCLGFREGDRCVLVNKTQDGWWLVNIGGREGWTPGDFWDEERRAQTVIMARPPSVAPQRLPPERKPRSQTVHDIFVSPSHSSTEPPSRDESGGSISLTGSLDGDRSPLSLSWSSERSRPAPPIVSAKPVKGKGPPPPKPKPLASAGSPLNARRNKPAVPQKPALPSRTPLSASPHRQLHRVMSPPGTTPSPVHSSRKSPSPPPHPGTTWRQGSSPHENGVSVMPVESEYSCLSEATTQSALETAPWFLGKMERIQAEQFLMEHGRQREFLVRERSAKDGYYALSIRYHYSCKHFNIDPTPDGQYAMGTMVFPTINDVVLHYQQNSLFIHDGQHITLGHPVKRRTRPSEASRPSV